MSERVSWRKRFLIRWAPWLFSVCPCGSWHRKPVFRCYCDWPENLYLYADGAWWTVDDPQAFAPRTVTMRATPPDTGAD